MKLGLQAKRVLITGSTKGIGYATAQSFLREGAHVWINGRSQSAVDAAVDALRKEFSDGAVRGVAADVGTAAGVAQLIAALPAVDVLVNNAGIFKPEAFTAIAREEWLRFFEVNVLSGAQLTQHYLPGMLERDWGRVIFVSSESAISTPAEMVHYGMTKTAQLAVSRVAAEMCRGRNVTVNSVLPGPTASEGVRDFVSELGVSEEQFFATARPSSIAQRFATSEEVADMIVFTASARAAMVNGAALRVDGGTAKVVF